MADRTGKTQYLVEAIGVHNREVTCRAELAHRDIEIERLTAELAKARQALTEVKEAAMLSPRLTELVDAALRGAP